MGLLAVSNKRVKPFLAVSNKRVKNIPYNADVDAIQMQQGHLKFVRGCDPSEKSLDIGEGSTEVDFWEFKLEFPTLVGAVNSSALLGGYLGFELRHTWSEENVGTLDSGVLVRLVSEVSHRDGSGECAGSCENGSCMEDNGGDKGLTVTQSTAVVVVEWWW